jgi:hypothetical protein
MILADPALDTAEDVLAALLTGSVEALDIPPALAEEARTRYTSVGTFLNRHGDAAGDAPWNVYPQGSFRLGTVVMPIDRSGEYDIDLVCVRQIKKNSITQVRLKSEVGAALQAFVRTEDGVASEEAGRCWTLDYRDLRFHMDVLPSIPDSEGSPTGILLTDRDVHEWLKSDPIGYSDWFRERMARELLRKRVALAEKRQSTIEDVPESLIKTTLQRAVQVLKRHRDIHFQRDPKGRPPSILITTLAAHAYVGEQNLYEAVVMMADTMHRHVQQDGNAWYVLNPVQPDENFADKWRTEPERMRNFFRWLDSLKRDLDEAQQQKGLHAVSERLAVGLGDVVMKAAERVGGTYRTARDSGALTMAAGIGMLSTRKEGRTVPLHGFYGVADPCT